MPDSTHTDSVSQANTPSEQPVIDATATALVALGDQPPTVMPGVIVTDVVPFPGPIVPVLLDTQQRRDAVLNAKSHHGYVLLLVRKTSPDERQEKHEEDALSMLQSSFELPAMQMLNHDLNTGDLNTDSLDPLMQEGDTPAAGGHTWVLSDFSPVAVLGKVLRIFPHMGDQPAALVQLLSRSEPLEIQRQEPFLIVRTQTPVEVVNQKESVFAALHRQLQITLTQFFDANAAAPDEIKQTAVSIQSPSILADFVAQHLARDFNERLSCLAELDLGKRMQTALEIAVREVELLTVGNRINDEIREKVEKHQRDFFLREQLKSIRIELGEESDPATLAVEQLKQELRDAKLPKIAEERAIEELKRLQMIPVESPEHGVIRSYLEWIASLPWSKRSDDQTDIIRARAILDEDHYGLDDVKDRIIEFLAVRQFSKRSAGSLLCFAGPPGVGKTSLGKSIARALGREFYRFSVGGMRDEAEIKGHRRTYIGAMPGRILQALKQVKTANPVIMLDELDKMGSDWRGDPSSAMLEVLDPAQNNTFLDHYLDLPFDLSSAMFIATANVKFDIPGPLLDRLEVIDLSGYIANEKVEIASRHLLKRQRLEHGLSLKQFSLGKRTIGPIIRDYTHEAGVRELDRLIAKLCRKRATELVQKKRPKAKIDPEQLEKYLGPPKNYAEKLVKKHRPGVAVGLAWTAAGGELLLIEAVMMPGKGQIKVTGHLGEVMTESTSIAISYVRNHAKELHIDPALFETNDLHLHFPAGAVPKDGPSAGVAITSALISLLRGKPLRSKIAMTGEITLRGEVLPVGGVREKVVAARREGVRTVILPKGNSADVGLIPEQVRNKLTFVYAERYSDLFSTLFQSF